MRYFLPILALVTTVGSSLRGQTSLTDTVFRIGEIEVRANRIERQQPQTARITTLDTELIRRNNSRSLSELLSENSVIHIKTLGQGALSTASFRGASSSHTQVSWNGISINSPMMGSFDFSQVPLFLTDGVALHHGAGAFRFGSGGLGGNVNFTNSDTDTTHLSFLGEYGANNTFTFGGTARYRLRKFTFRTRLYYQQSDNDYRYLNKVLMKDPFYEHRRNADYSQIGAMQEAYWKPSSAGQFAAFFWFQQDERNLPPPIIVNVSGKEHQTSQNFRTLARYTHKRGAAEWNVSAAALFGTIDYSRRFDIGLGDLFTHSQSTTVLAKGDYSYRLSDPLLLGGAINYRFDAVGSSNYDQRHARHTASMRLFGQYKPSNWTIEGQTMLETIGETPAVTYNIGATYRPLSIVGIKLSNAYNHRFPTMNDLYWSPGGNPNLKPEQGFTTDATVSYTPTFGPIRLNIEATGYFSNIENWIMWIPTGNGYIWEPANFARVVSKGFELRAESSLSAGHTSHRLTANYAYTHSVDRSERTDGTKGKQLPYVPRNKWNLSYLFGWRALEFGYVVSYTDVRFTSADESYSTPAYTIHNLTASYAFRLKKCQLKLRGRIDNLFDSYYESTQYYPMPLRSFTVGLQVSL